MTLIKKKWVLVSACIALVISIAISVLGVYSNGFSNWDIFKTQPPIVVPPTVPPVDDDYMSDSDVNSDIVYDMPSNIVFSAPTSMSATASEGIVLKAKVSPEDATEKGILWSVAWVDANDTFAIGKNATDFVSVESIADSTSARLTCFSPFGSRVKVIVSSVYEPSLKAECVLDYVRKIKSVTAKFTWSVLNTNSGIRSYTESHTLGNGLPKVMKYYSLNRYEVQNVSVVEQLNFEYENMPYTIEDAFVCSLEFRLSDEFKSYTDFSTASYSVTSGDTFSFGSALFYSLFGADFMGNASWQTNLSNMYQNIPSSVNDIDLLVNLEGKYSKFTQKDFVKIDRTSIQPTA